MNQLNQVSQPQRGVEGEAPTALPVEGATRAPEIEAKNLIKQYGPLLALDGLSFKMHPGEVVGLLGPNGAGKTTTMRILTGYMPPTSGQVFVAGQDLLENPKEAKQKMGYLPETPPLYPELTIEESLAFVAGLRGIKKAEKKEKIEKALEKTSLKDMRKRLVGNMSKGYRQRIGIAQAILHAPPFLILDEPTIGLDPKQIAEIRELIRNLKGDRAILLSSHILQEISLVCDRVIIIHRGKIVADGNIQELTAPLQKKRFVVTASPQMGEEVKQVIGSLPGVENIMDYASDLEDLFLQLTQENQKGT